MPDLPGSAMERIQDHLTFLYGQEQGAATGEKLRRLLRQFLERNPELPKAGGDPTERLSEADAVLITYGDQVREANRPPLQTLAGFLQDYLSGVVSTVHILPFFPYSSDDGFSVIDYTVVDPDLGTWADVARIGRSFRLMFDAVINHISAESDWFRAFRQDEAPYSDFFIVVEPGTDLSLVTRPRALPLLTPIETPSGKKLVWTTFSADQIDLNYANPELLLAILQVLLLYVEQGADILRLDAIAYLWKEVGTTCIHLSQTHRVVQLMRAVLDAVAPHMLLITETNVPHAENVSYFGNGKNEAQLVYQFSLAPLLLNAFHTGHAGHLLRWAASLETPSESTTFFNFTASHDGVGVRPAEGILDAAALQQLVDRAQAYGGYVSFKINPDGSQSPYELNISFFDALSNPALADQEGLDLQIDRFMASQAIMLSLAGVPGIYVHSLLGSRSWHAGVEESGRLRTINREKLWMEDLEAALTDPGSLRHRVFERYTHLLRVRRAHPAFHPNSPQQVVGGNNALFALLRTPAAGGGPVLCLHNVSDRQQSFQTDLSELGVHHAGNLTDLVAGSIYPTADRDRLHVRLGPYQVLWLRA